MKRLISVAVAGAILASTQASATVSDDDFAKLKADFAAMAARLSSLEAENANLRELSETTVSELELAQTDLAVVKKGNSASSWAERIKVKGDFRYRYEEIDAEGSDERDRTRIRARAALIATTSDDTEVGLGIATGGDDPVSTNQTLGGGGSTKDVRLDLAYGTWQATDNIYLTAGKIKNPFYRPQKTAFMWDGDYNPEGFAGGWSSDHLFAAFSGNWLESDSKSSNQQFSWGIQGGMKFALGEATLTTGLGYYDIPTKGKNSFFGDDDDFFGNSFECRDPSDTSTCVYKFNYEEVEVFADLGLSLFDRPLNIFAQYVQNQDADDYDVGWVAGANYGKASGKGTWQMGYQYQDLEKDAILGLTSDSDFAGGGTDGKGHRLTGAYGLNKRWKVGFTWFLDNEAGEGNLETPISYDRFQIDTSFKY
jgi:hypothetical protein